MILPTPLTFYAAFHLAKSVKQAGRQRKEAKREKMCADAISRDSSVGYPPQLREGYAQQLATLYDPDVARRVVATELLDRPFDQSVDPILYHRAGQQARDGFAKQHTCNVPTNLLAELYRDLMIFETYNRQPSQQMAMGEGGMQHG